MAEEKVITVAFKSDTACTHKFKLTLQLGECAFCCAFCLQPHLLMLKSEAFTNSQQKDVLLCCRLGFYHNKQVIFWINSHVGEDPFTF